MPARYITAAPLRAPAYCRSLLFRDVTASYSDTITPADVQEFFVDDDDEEGDSESESAPEAGIRFSRCAVWAGLGRSVPKDDENPITVEVVVYRGSGTPVGVLLGTAEIEVGAEELWIGHDSINSLIPWPPGHTAVAVYLAEPPAVPHRLVSFVLEPLAPSSIAEATPPTVQGIPERVAELFARFAHDTSKKKRWELSGWIAALGEPALEPLLWHTAAPDPAVRVIAVRTLQWGSFPRFDRIVEPLIRALADPDAEVRGEAVVALMTINWDRPEPRACEPLIGMLADPDPIVRQHVVHALSPCCGARAVAPLIRVLEDGGEDSTVRAEAALVLGRTGDARALQALLGALGADDEGLQRRGSVIAGVRMFGAMALEPVIALLGDDNWLVRRNAARVLADFDDAPAADALLTALDDPHRDVQVAAAESLGLLRELRAVDALIGMLRHDSTEVREKVVRALGQIGDARALPVLEQLRDHYRDTTVDDEMEVRDTVRYAIYQIESRMDTQE